MGTAPALPFAATFGLTGVVPPSPPLPHFPERHRHHYRHPLETSCALYHDSGPRCYCL